MALTLEIEHRLNSVGLINFFEESNSEWRMLAEHSYQFVASNFPQEATIRTDDVAKALTPLLEVNDDLNIYLDSNKLKQRYWIRDFGDLILDRTWNAINH